MGKKVKSARGELVDFDLLKIKEQMASAPPPTDVRARQDFVDKRLRRRLKKVQPPAPKLRQQKKEEEVVVEDKNVAPLEEDVTADENVEVTAEQEQNSRSRQKAKPTPKKED